MQLSSRVHQILLMMRLSHGDNLDRVFNYFSFRLLSLTNFGDNIVLLTIHKSWLQPCVSKLVKASVC